MAFFISGLDSGDVSAGCIVPFLVSSTFGDSQVGFIVPGMGVVWSQEKQYKKQQSQPVTTHLELLLDCGSKQPVLFTQINPFSIDLLGPISCAAVC
jgi:hypothetical protein